MNDNQFKEIKMMLVMNAIIQGMILGKLFWG